MSLKELVPDWYEGVREFNVLFSVEDDLIFHIKENIEKIKHNQWIQTADEATISYHEQLLGIIANPDVEDLTFRRQRILSRLQSKPPFTFRYLKDHLNQIFGENKYSLTIDYNSYSILLETVTENASWFREVENLINQVKPANMVYVQIPLFIQSIKMNETATIQAINYFRLGKGRVGRDSLRQRSAEREVILQ